MFLIAFSLAGGLLLAVVRKYELNLFNLFWFDVGALPGVVGGMLLYSMIVNGFGGPTAARPDTGAKLSAFLGSMFTCGLVGGWAGVVSVNRFVKRWEERDRDRDSE